MRKNQIDNWEENKMTKFEIGYNPYTYEYRFTKNGIEIKGDQSKLYSKSENRYRIQQLITPERNWSGLFSEIQKECNDKDIQITFHGRKIDFEDLCYGKKYYDGDAEFDLKLVEECSDADVIRELDDEIDDIKRNISNSQNDKESSEVLSAFMKPHDNGYGKETTIFDAYDRAKNGILDISVMGTMSSGKSTLINALFGKELLPSENKDCTANIVNILDDDNMDKYTVVCYGDGNKEIIPERELEFDDNRKCQLLEQYNDNKEIKRIDIRGNIPYISSKKIKLNLRDTPGANSNNDDHVKLTNEIINEDKSMVIYVMNASTPEIKDDKQLLHSIALQIKRSGKEARDRFIFIFNKCDDLDEEKESVKDAINRAKEYLRAPDIGIDDPVIIPASARLAFLLREKMDGKTCFTRKENETLSSISAVAEEEALHYEQFATLSPSVKEELDKECARCKQRKDIDNEALIHTGIPALEYTINEYIEKYAYTMKINDAVKDILDIIKSLNMKASFEEALSSDKEKLDKVRRQLADAQNKREDLDCLVNEFNEKTSGFNLPDNIDSDARRELNKNMGELNLKYNNIDLVDISEAQSLIKEYEQILNNVQNETHDKLLEILDKQVYLKGSQLLDEYRYSVNKILDNINIEGYDFKKDYQFSGFMINDLNSRIVDNEVIRYRKETRQVVNSERKGWGILKFWKPYHILEDYDVKDGTDVNIKKIIVDVQTEFTTLLNGNIDELCKDAKKQVKEYSKTFKNNLGCLNIKVKETIDEIDNKTRDQKKLKEEYSNNKHWYEWIDNKERAFESILSLQSEKENKL